MNILEYIKHKTVGLKSLSLPKPTYFFTGLVLLSTACKKTEYLDTDNSNRPPLSAKVKLVNALNISAPINFLDFTRQINTAGVTRNTATAYLETQFGKVQYNTTEGTTTGYKSSYVFGGSANFQQETDKASFSGPNGPIADFYHTLFTVAKRKPSALNPGNRDSLILVYDDLTAPTAGKAKIRFANFSPDAPNLNFGLVGGAPVFTNVAYGNFADQTVIPYDANGKGPNTVTGLTWKTLGPFKEINPTAGAAFEIRNNTTNTVVPVTGTTLNSITLQDGKIYTIYINGTVAASNLTATILAHN